MTVRKIIQIDKEKCNGCGLCAEACHEGAIGIVDGKARLLRDDYCDGLGDCLPTCPTGAITFVEREALPYDAEAVAVRMAARKAGAAPAGGCPGAAARAMARPEDEDHCLDCGTASHPSQLRQWPVQIKLAPPRAPFYDGAKLLLAADCAAYAYAGFHEDFMRGQVVLIGCPKLDDVDYAEKLAAILRDNDIAEVTVARMEVPCCGGLTAAAQRALQASGKDIPMRIAVIGTDGRLVV